MEALEFRCKTNKQNKTHQNKTPVTGKTRPESRFVYPKLINMKQDCISFFFTLSVNYEVYIKQRIMETTKVFNFVLILHIDVTFKKHVEF